MTKSCGMTSVKKKKEKNAKKRELAKSKTRKGGLGKNERPGGLKT
jgi:hypothetical protein